MKKSSAEERIDKLVNDLVTEIAKLAPEKSRDFRIDIVNRILFNAGRMHESKRRTQQQKD